MSGSEASVRIGRSPSTSHAELSHVALELFVERGFDETTIEDIAAAAGIGRRTFFRYFASKNDLPWGEFDLLLADMARYLANLPETMPIVDALRQAVIEFNRFPDVEIDYHRRRMQLLLTVPSLVAHSTLRYADWRAVISRFVADRLGVAEDSLEPQAMAWAFLGVSISAYEQWLKRADSDLIALLEAAYDMLDTSFDSRRR